MFDQDTSLAANSINKQGSRESLVQQTTFFLRKARNATLIKGRYWRNHPHRGQPHMHNTTGNMLKPSPNISLNCTHKALTETLRVRVNIFLFRSQIFRPQE